MTTFPAQSVDRVIESMEDWKAQGFHRRLEFYQAAQKNHHLFQVVGQDKTKRASNCDVCHHRQPKGIRKLWFERPMLVHGVPCGNAKESFWCHFCDGCWNLIEKPEEVKEVTEELETA